MTQVYLLSAGKGLRAGGPKAWKEYRGQPLLKRHLDFLLARFKPQDIAVSIQASWRARCLKLNSSIGWVDVAPEASAMGAFISLLQAHPITHWGFLYHVDMPVWDNNLFNAMEHWVESSKSRSNMALIPTYKGKKGHPVLISSQIHAQLINLSPEHDRLDRVLSTYKTEMIELPSSAILENWNYDIQTN